MGWGCCLWRKQISACLFYFQIIKLGKRRDNSLIDDLSFGSTVFAEKLNHLEMFVANEYQYFFIHFSYCEGDCQAYYSFCKVRVTPMLDKFQYNSKVNASCGFKLNTKVTTFRMNTINIDFSEVRWLHFKYIFYIYIWEIEKRIW